MAHVRAKMKLETTFDVANFVSKLNSDGTTDKYILEDFDGVRRVDARSYLGVMYASAEFDGETYLVNLTEDGKFPTGIDLFRPN